MLMIFHIIVLCLSSKKALRIVVVMLAWPWFIGNIVYLFAPWQNICRACAKNIRKDLETDLAYSFSDRIEPCLFALWQNSAGNEPKGKKSIRRKMDYISQDSFIVCVMTKIDVLTDMTCFGGAWGWHLTDIKYNFGSILRECCGLELYFTFNHYNWENNTREGLRIFVLCLWIQHLSFDSHGHDLFAVT